MKTIKLFIISVLLLSSFQALAGRYTSYLNVYENENATFASKWRIDSISFFESNIDADQFIIKPSGITLKKQNYEALENKTIRLETRVKFTGQDYMSAIILIYTILDVAEAPKNIQLSNKTIEDGSASGTVIGTVTATDEDAGTDSTKLSYHLEGSTSNKDFSINSKGELSIKAKVDKKQKGDYYFSVSVSDPQGNKSKNKDFHITVTDAIPKFAITTVDVSTLEKVAKVIDLTANKDNVSFVIGGGSDRDKFSLPEGSNKLTFAATDFEVGSDNTYSVVIIASKTGEAHIAKTITVTVLELDRTLSRENVYRITTADAFSTPENTAKVIDLTTNGNNSDSGFISIDFAILPGADANKFTLAGNKLTFKATDFEARSDVAYRVKVQAIRTVRFGVLTSIITAEKTITVTVTDLDDEAPTNIQISNTNLLKGQPAGTVVGTLSATDIDTAADALTFTITNNADFEIVNRNQLKTKRPIAAIGDMTITVTVSDGVQHTRKDFTIKVIALEDEGELVITTTDVATPENADKVIVLTVNRSDISDVSFAITGGADKAKFSLSGNTLTFAATDFEARSDHTYSVIITASEAGKSSVSKTITVTVTDLNDVAPTNIQISNTNLLKGQPAGTVVGTLSATDIDTAADALTFTITNNADFEIVNRNQLKTKRPIAAIGDMTITVTVSDGVQHTRKDFTIKVIALEDEGELVITTTDVATPENADKVIVLTVNRSDISDVSFAITGGADKAKFSLSGNTLTFAATDFEARSDHAYSVIITASEAGKSSVSKTITVTVTDLNDEAPTNIQISNTNLIAGLPADTLVGTLSATDLDTATDALTFTTTSTDFKIVNGNQLKTKRSITAIGDMTITVTVSDGIQSVNQEFSIKVTEETKELVITTANVSTPENVAKVITLTASQRGVNFSITGGRNQAKFSLSGNTLTFEATSFKNPGDNTYQVNIKATKGNDTTEKTLTVTVEASTRAGVGARAVAIRMAAQAVRKESKTASKVLLFKVGKTLMGRLSHIRHKDKQKSSSSANGFVSGIQVSFADSQTNSLINHVLSANGLSNVIPTSSRKIERWDTWTSAKVVIGKSNGTGADKTKFNLKSLNMGMDRRIAKDKIIGFALSLGKQDRTATGNDFSGDVDTTQYTLSSYGALELNDKGSIEAVLGVAQATHKVNNASSADQDSDGFFASIAYRVDLQTKGVELSPFIRYDISRIKMKASDVLTNSETVTNEAIALGIEINKQVNYRDGQLNRFVSVEYKSDIRRDTSDYLSKNAEQEVSVKLGLDYQKDNTSASVSYERIQSTNNKAHSDGIEGAIQWKF